MARVFREKRSLGGIKKYLFIVLVIAIVVGIWWFASSLGKSHDEEKIKLVQEAVVRATVQCYSLEGRYPMSLEYLEENYGLTLDRSKYVYFYNVIGVNMMPDIRVFPN